jgi:hypothetical protein
MFDSLGDVGSSCRRPTIANIHRIYAFVAGRGNEALADRLRQLAKTFVTRDGAQAC